MLSIVCNCEVLGNGVPPVQYMSTLLLHVAVICNYKQYNGTVIML
jgi:hypothetical protein